MKAPAQSPGCMILGTAALLLVLFLVVGWLLPGTWTARRTEVLNASPASLFALADSPDGWKRWTPWPDSGLVRDGPAQGPGSRLSWNDPELGDGSFEIVETIPDSLVRYRVVVQGGSMHTDGLMQMTAADGGTRVTWRESGDFGPNPLMGYWAFFMSRAQGNELEKALARLETLADKGAGSGASTRPNHAKAPPDSASTGASH